MSLKSILVEAGRYDDIIKILSEITSWCVNSDIPQSIAVNPYISYNKETCREVDRDKVILEALKLKNIIELEKEDSFITAKFENLEQYIRTISDDQLHNYAVSLTHRRESDSEKLNLLRIWLILDTMLLCWLDIHDWNIPDGWKSDKVYKFIKGENKMLKVNKYDKDKEYKKVVKICCTSLEDMLETTDRINDLLNSLYSAELEAEHILVFNSQDLRALGTVKKRILYAMQDQDGINCVYIYIHKDCPSNEIYLPIKF